ncbi:glycosyltransferase family 4 protein [Marinomonas aquiplantarum]|uniref:Glycosyltransferase involved in cell wall biosynthesis n=1 Tax=Marinomonas aquiplantarum TaxID=491951 RepID=A0A366D1P9_9GAMM|nr:glycosyltransferase family 4 protein [Marinomonas aquiplantarum]RBO83188.1 glycosyltransferase involved in cell wall biosynthesis [Marinomonas aquiplantarum]
MNQLSVLHVNLAKGFRGGERQTELLIKELSKVAGIRQTLACRQSSPLRERLYKTKNLIFKDVNNQISGLLSPNKFDIVHAHEAKAVHWAYLNNIIHKTPYIITRRVDTQVKNKWLNIKSYSNSSAIVGISNLISQHLSEKKWGDVYTIPSSSAQLNRSLHVGKAFKDLFTDKFIIGHVGALVDKHKGQKILIEVANLLEQSDPDIHFVFFGDGADKEELHQLTVQSKNITWMGFKDNIGDFLPFLDIFAFPSRNEGLGSTLLDVMESEVPIVASNVGGIPDIIRHKNTGILVKPNDAAELKDALLSLRNNGEERKNLIINAKKFVENYTPNKMAERYLNLYHSKIHVIKSLTTPE